MNWAPGLTIATKSTATIGNGVARRRRHEHGLISFLRKTFLPGILREGLTKGGTPIIEGGMIRLQMGHQWLTAENDPRKHSWNTHNLVSYSRTEVRLTVSIPDSYRKKLVKATDLVKTLPPEGRDIITDYGGSESWYIYKGRIPPSWIVGYELMKEA